MFKYVALGKNIFVKELPANTNIGTFVMPESLDTDFTFGEVVSCSNVFSENGSYIQNPVHVGDKIAFPKISGTKITLNNESLIRVFVEDVVAVEAEIEEIEEK